MTLLPLQFGRRARVALVLVTVGSIVVGIWFNWEYLPGTLRHDNFGIAHGSGTYIHKYDTGQKMVEESYLGGRPYRTIWYRPDGSVVAKEEYDEPSRAIDYYYLRQDGSIRAIIECKWSSRLSVHVANGEGTFFKQDGSIDKVQRYSEGEVVPP